jgi:PTH1 family peptidyl-tRNA hydrolase
MTILIIGLGNPGLKYVNTRHNAGFSVVKRFAEKNGFPEFKLSKKENSLVSSADIKGEKTVLALPQTFMNNSGKAAKSLIKKYSPEKLLLIHDDIDLISGSSKLSKNRGSAGHKGVDSVIKEIGTKDFWRLRIGIRPQEGKPKEVEKFVLRNFRKEEKEEMLAAIGKLEDFYKA